MDKIRIPGGAGFIMSLLAAEGFDAYAVGGCVRDSLLGLEPHDWDICTDARPGDVLRACERRRIRTVETGLRHGTVTAVLDGVGYEVTTYRVDGAYSDGRHPDGVTFTGSLTGDLARRDFTVNAMAYNEKAGLVDPFGGREALRDKTIACVGDPSDRFGEDVLRIMRALRFASVYGFRIDRGTELAIHRLAPSLRRISPERVSAELRRLLCGRGVLDVLLGYADVVTVIIPELAPCVGFNQNNPWHRYDVYEHTARAVAAYAGDDVAVKMALLLHDAGKPRCYTEDGRGSHFYGHGALGRGIADEVTRRLRFDNRTRAEVLDLVLYHDADIEPAPRAARRWLNRIGKDRLRQLIQVRMADIRAQAENTQAPRLERCRALEALADGVIGQKQCFSLKDLAIHGGDVMALGAPEGKIVGDTLRHVLEAVIDGSVPNEPGPQTDMARRYLAGRLRERGG